MQNNLIRRLLLTAWFLSISLPIATAGEPAVMQMERAFADMVETGQRAGVVWILRKNGATVSSGALGWQDRDRRIAMKMSTTFRLYSMTRAITSVAALRLVDQGQLSVADPIEKYIPAFANPRVLVDPTNPSAGTEPARRSVTIRDLLTYTAGFGYAPDYPAALGLKRDDVIGLDTTIAAGVDHLASFPLLFQPGEKWHYGFSSDVLGRVIEIVTRKNLDEALRALVLDPVEMRDTGFNTKPHRLARAYGIRGGNLVDVTDELPKSSDYLRRGSMHSGGGGLVSTVEDYLKFCEMLRLGGLGPSGRLLAESTVNAMVTNQLLHFQGPLFWHQRKPSPLMMGGGWGLGVGVRTTLVADDLYRSNQGEIFWGGLAGTSFFIDPSTGISAVVMSQHYGAEGDDVAYVLRKGIH